MSFNLVQFSGSILRDAIRWVASLPITERECVICGHRLLRFLPYRRGSKSISPFMRELNMVGSNIDHFACPWCRAHDRERHLFLFMRESGILESLHGKRLLHFAPEFQLSRIFHEAKPEEYVRCDLFPWEEDIIKADLLALPFHDGHFDLVMANHVLEHVADDRRAVQEIARVLKPSGLAILQTPFSSVLEHTWEDAGICSEAARLQAYGQEDHVRLFGKDVFKRIAASGLEPLVRQHEELLPAYAADKFGINPNEPLFLFRKH